MNELKEKIERMRLIAEMFDEEDRHALAGTTTAFISDFIDCRNELCLRCESFTESHLGACDGCRWRM